MTYLELFSFEAERDEKTFTVALRDYKKLETNTTQY